MIIKVQFTIKQKILSEVKLVFKFTCEKGELNLIFPVLSKMGDIRQMTSGGNCRSSGNGVRTKEVSRLEEQTRKTGRFR